MTAWFLKIFLRKLSALRCAQMMMQEDTHSFQNTRRSFFHRGYW